MLKFTYKTIFQQKDCNCSFQEPFSNNIGHPKNNYYLCKRQISRNHLICIMYIIVLTMIAQNIHILSSWLYLTYMPKFANIIGQNGSNELGYKIRNNFPSLLFSLEKPMSSIFPGCFYSNFYAAILVFWHLSHNSQINYS